MPNSIKDIIQNVSSKKEIDGEMLASMVDFVFKKTKEQFYKYEELSLYLPGLFIFFYGKKRLLKLKEQIETYIECKEKGVENKFIPSSFRKMTDDEINDYLKKVDALLMRYEQYINEKRTIRNERREIKNKFEEYKRLSTGELEENKGGYYGTSSSGIYEGAD